MTIALLFAHLLTNPTPIASLYRNDLIALIRENTVVPVSSNTEAEEYYRCIRHVHSDILQQAQHKYALELGSLSDLRIDHPAVLYLTRELSGNGYQRPPKNGLRERFTWLIKHIDRYLSKDLNRTLEDVQYDIDRCNDEVEVARRRGEIITVDDAYVRVTSHQQILSAARNLLEDPVVASRLVSSFIRDAQEGRGRSITGMFRTGVSGLLENMLARDRGDGAEGEEGDDRMDDEEEDEEEDREREEMERLNKLCSANDSIRVKVFDPSVGREVVHYVRRSQLDPIRNLLLEPVATAMGAGATGGIGGAIGENDDPICGICLHSKGTLTCGNKDCSYRMCFTCFNEWFLSNTDCPQCRREYIPLTMRRVKEEGTA